MSTPTLRYSHTEASTVYFRRDERGGPDGVYVGHSDRPAGRARSHEREGRRFIAGLHASHDDEVALHRALAPYRVDVPGTRSVYAGDTVWSYIAWLLTNGYATDREEEVVHLPRLPFDAWSPIRASEFADRAGQLSLAESVAAPLRAEYAHSLGYLSSQGDEWYSPPCLVEPARMAMGTIDCDPASCSKANETIKATFFYSKEVSGLNPSHPWRGNVWLNPPYGRGDESAGKFVARLADEVREGNVRQAVLVLNVASFTTNWFRPLHDLAAAFAFIYGRPNFIPPKTDLQSSSPNKAIVVPYVGANLAGFIDEFRPIAKVLTND